MCWIRRTVQSWAKENMVAMGVAIERPRWKSAGEEDEYGVLYGAVDS